MGLFGRSQDEGARTAPGPEGRTMGSDLTEAELRELGLSADEVDRMGGLEAIAASGEPEAADPQDEVDRAEEELAPEQRDMMRQEAEEAIMLGLPRPEGAREKGPFDASEVPGPRNRVDLGSLWVPGVPGMQLRLETNRQSGQVTAVNIALAESNLQLQAYAAPRSGGLWEEIRQGLVDGLEKSGSHGAVVEGPFGSEIHARMPVSGQLGDKQTSQRTAPVRFLGIEGPRWFLRAVISGKAAVDREKAALMYALVRACVVHRDDTPREPRSLLPLNIPSEDPENGSMAARAEQRAG